MPEHPMQPLVWDGDIIRFKENKIVNFIKEWARENGMGLNELAMMPFSEEDWEQFYQLIGFSVSGYGDLDLRPEVVARADVEAERMIDYKERAKKGKKK
jgi:hypothetical protein